MGHIGQITHNRQFGNICLVGVKSLDHAKTLFGQSYTWDRHEQPLLYDGPMKEVRLSPKIRLAIVKATIVLVPCYAVAWLTEKMVYVVPTLAAAAFFAGALDVSDLERRRVDDDSESDDHDDQAESEYQQEVGSNHHEIPQETHTESYDEHGGEGG